MDTIAINKAMHAKNIYFACIALFRKIVSTFDFFEFNLPKSSHLLLISN